jgi:hypothetical protein
VQLVIEMQHVTENICYLTTLLRPARELGSSLVIHQQMHQRYLLFGRRRNQEFNEIRVTVHVSQDQYLLAPCVVCVKIGFTSL